MPFRFSTRKKNQYELKNKYRIPISIKDNKYEQKANFVGTIMIVLLVVIFILIL